MARRKYKIANREDLIAFAKAILDADVASALFNIEDTTEAYIAFRGALCSILSGKPRADAGRIKITKYVMELLKDNKKVQETGQVILDQCIPD